MLRNVLSSLIIHQITVSDRECLAMSSTRDCSVTVCMMRAALLLYLWRSGRVPVPTLRERDGTKILMTVNFGDAVKHSALSSALGSYNMVDSREHASFFNPVLVGPFKRNLL